MAVSGNSAGEAGSRILFHRRLDHDPYLVVADQRAIWLQDAYTVSDALPYSQADRDGVNYIRNSVKIALDAYDSTVTFFMADPTDPLVARTPASSPRSSDRWTMSPSLRQHIRYPEDIFRLQAAVYGTYA